MINNSSYNNFNLDNKNTWTVAKIWEYISEALDSEKTSAEEWFKSLEIDSTIENTILLTLCKNPTKEIIDKKYLADIIYFVLEQNELKQTQNNIIIPPEEIKKVTPLMIAVENNKIELVRILLGRLTNSPKTSHFKKTWVDINARAPHGQTALIYAKSEEMVDLLLENGADPKVTDIYGLGILHRLWLGEASEEKEAENIKITKKMLGLGLDINMQGVRGSGILNEVVTRDYSIDAIQTLINFGANVNLRGEEDEDDRKKIGTPLSSLLKTYCSSVDNFLDSATLNKKHISFLEKFRVLIENGADINIGKEQKEDFYSLMKKLRDNSKINAEQESDFLQILAESQLNKQVNKLETENFSI